jgi:polyhydroxyalkanoate synthase
MTGSASGLSALVRQLAQAQTRLQERWRVDGAGSPDEALTQAIARAFANDPQKLQALHSEYVQAQFDLWRRMLREGAPADVEPSATDDPRFRAPEWRELPWFDYLRSSHRLAGRWLQALIDALPLDAPERHRIAFFGRQFLDAASPANFAFTNPEVIRLALQTGGRSLGQGLENLRSDIDRGRLSMCDESAFAVGRNLALTPGAVVFRNELIELLQYAPATARVRQRPLLVVPPFINKYYILDLQAHNSFVRHCVAQGITVFMISWRNVDASTADLTWDDYIVYGVHAALEAVRAIQPRRAVNVLGFCVGGTLLATALAVMPAAKRRAIATLTLLASMLDFSDTGDIGAYVDEAYVKHCEATLGRGGVFPGRSLAQAFASLRANDLVWRYVVGNYLKGETPPAFDLLYWNGDSANLAGPLYAYYLRNMYLENALRHPGRLTLCGQPVELDRLTMPAYVLAAKDDHIVPWRTAHASAALLRGPTTFVRAASGHIAGVISPPGHRRRSYRTGPIAPTAQAWEDASSEHPGSWWEHWHAWLAPQSGPLVAAPKRLGSARLPPLEPAPGRYVLASGDAAKPDPGGSP